MSETIVSERLELEPLEARHAAALFDGLQHPDIYRFIEEQPPRDLEALTERYRKLATRRSPDGRELWLNWAIRSPPHDAYVGYVQATVRPTGGAEIAYVLIPTWWRRGFGREAVAAMLGELRDQYQIQAFSAQVHPANLRSVALLEYLGFTLASTTPTAAGPDDLIYQLVR